MPMLEVEPMAGLCNRMRVIHSAYWLAKDLGTELKIRWTPYKGLNSSYSSLFKDPEEFSVLECSRDIFHENRLFSIYFAFRSLGHSKSLNLMKSKSLRRFRFSDLETKRRILIASVHQFYASDKPFYQFEPLDWIKERINVVSEQYALNTVGVHIRRVDHQISIRISTTEKFIRAMNGILETDPATVFFLSTDDPKEEHRLTREFGSKVLYNQKVLDRNFEPSITDALVDLYCLGQTHKIIGSYYSSFSEVAARINDIPIEIVT
jgi:hypothetical protein